MTTKSNCFVAVLLLVSFSVGVMFSSFSKCFEWQSPAVSTSKTTALRYHDDSINNYNSTNHSSYELAKRQSNGFFTDVSDTDWNRYRQRVASRQNHLWPENKTGFMNESNKWYQFNWEPDFTCAHERRVGGMGDGPKWVCDPHRINPKGCLVYSIGSSGKTDFERGVLSEIGRDCEIHTFDPADFASAMPGGIIFHAWGITNATHAAADASPYNNFKTLPQTIQALGHEGRTIDIFKIDCEGCEWDTFEDWFASGVTLRQILVEVHFSPNPKANEFFERLQKEGYVTFHKEPNTFGCQGRCQEYALLKLNQEFFEG